MQADLRLTRRALQVASHVDGQLLKKFNKNIPPFFRVNWQRASKTANRKF